MEKEYIKVEKELFVSDEVSTLTPNGWQGALPGLYTPNPIERIIHFFGGHFTFGQPYCVACGLKKV